jgi:dTDP-4-dehydrorhamnose 3,5-epimerase
MKITKTKLEDCLIIKPKIFLDKRGFFYESFNIKSFKKNNIPTIYKQDNFSKSKKNVLRGLHFQKKKPQAKFFYVSFGKVLDVVVDLRKKSKTFLRYQKFIISSQNKHQIYIPPGFAHGFLVLSEIALCHYKCTNYYDPEDDGSIVWNDKSLNINWNIKNPILSDKDKDGMNLNFYI